MELDEVDLYLKSFSFSDVELVAAFIKKFNLFNVEDKLVYTSGVGSLVYKERI